MAIDLEHAQDLLCSRLCSTVRLIKREPDLYMLDSPFAFPDGDHYPVYVQALPTGGVRLSDGGHTLLHLSYENEVSAFRQGTRGRLLEQILGETGIQEEAGEFYLEVSLDGIAEGVFRLGQGLTKVCDLMFLNRVRVRSTFYEDLDAVLLDILPEEKITRDYIDTRMENAADYPIDYYIPGRNNVPLYLFGVPGRDKARLVTIILERLLRHDLAFDSILVFENQQEMPRPDVARLTNVGGEMVASLDASRDLRRKITWKAA